jgi:hypothetical protein
MDSLFNNCRIFLLRMQIYTTFYALGALISREKLSKCDINCYAFQSVVNEMLKSGHRLRD